MINIYKGEATGSAISTDDSSPLFTTHNKKRFHPHIQKLYVRNDDTAIWVSDLKVYSTSTSYDIYSGTGNFGVKFYVGELEPTDRVWDSVTYNRPAEFPSLGTVGASDTTTFLPFWMRSEVSGGAPIALYKGNLVCTYIEHAV